MPVCGRFRKSPQAGLYKITGSPDNNTFTKSRKEGFAFFPAFPSSYKPILRHSFRFKPYSIPLDYIRLPSFYLFILSLIRSLPYSLAGEIFPCKGTASFRSSSTAPLTGSRIERQPSQIEDDLPVPAVLRCRVGYSVQSPAVSLPLPHFPAVWPACKIYPDKEAGTASDKREEKV